MTKDQQTNHALPSAEGKGWGVTPHFRLSEFINSQTAQRKGIDNSVPLQYVDNIKRLCTEVLEPLRQHFGQPIVINSGYRCPALNRAVGGARNSYHLQGRAADIIPAKGNRRQILNEWYSFLKTLHPKELIHEGTWLHVAI